MRLCNGYLIHFWESFKAATDGLTHSWSMQSIVPFICFPDSQYLMYGYNADKNKNGNTAPSNAKSASGKKNNKSHFFKIKTILSHFMFGWNNITAPIISFQSHQLLTHLSTGKRGSAIFVPAATIFIAFSWNLAIKYTKQSAITVNYFKFLQWIADFLWIFKRKDNLVDKVMEEGSLFSSTVLTIFNQNAPNFVHKSSEQLSNIPHFLKFLKPTAIFLSNFKNEATLMPLCSWNIGISFKIAWKKGITRPVSVLSILFGVSGR